MGYLTKWGGIWGFNPVTTGSIFFVAPVSSSSASYTIENRSYTASDGNDGLSPERALATVKQAISLATANNGDIICLLPGTHNASTATNETAAGNIAVNKAGLTFIGLPAIADTVVTPGVIKPPAIITAPAATIAVSVTAARTTFLNLSILPITQKAGIDFTTAANHLTVANCFFDLATPVGHASTKGLAATGATQAPTYLYVKNCVFEEDNTGTTHGPALDVGAAIAFRVEGNSFYNLGTGAAVTAWAIAVQVNDVAHGMFAGNKFFTLLGSAAAITAGIKGVSMTGASELQLWNNQFGVTVTNPFNNFAGADCDLCLNYVATVAGGTGGTLITSTT